MGREKRPLNPTESHRRLQKRKAVEKKRKARKEVLTRIPLARRDPSTLLVEIERLRNLESDQRLDGPGRMRRKHLEEQFTALNKAREKAGLPIMLLPDFDPEVYKARRQSEPLTTTNETKDDKIQMGEEKEIPMPDDTPYETGVPGLPPYLDAPLSRIEVVEDVVVTAVASTPSGSVIIRGETNVSSKDHLAAQVNQFLDEMGL